MKSQLLRSGRVATVFLCAAFLASAAAFDLPLVVEESAGVPRLGEPVTSGIPLPVGTQTAHWALFDGAQEIPAQITTLSGRIPWLLLDFQVDVPASGEKIVILRDRASGAGPAKPLMISEDADQITVITAPLKLILKKNPFDLLDAGWFDADGDGKFTNAEQILRSSGNNMQIVDSTSGQTFSGAGIPEQLRWEYQGSMRATLRVDGRYRNATGEFIAYTTRMSFYAGQSFVKIEHILRNSCQPNERPVKFSSAMLKVGRGAIAVRSPQPGATTWVNVGPGGVTFEVLPATMWGLNTTSNSGIVLPDLSHHGVTLVADFTPHLSSTQSTDRAKASQSPLFARAPAAWYAQYGELSTSLFSTLDDEKQAYQQWGWGWTPTQEPIDAAKPGYLVGWNNIDVHDDSEADDVWQNILMYLRTGQRGYWDRARGWARYYKYEYTLRTDGFSYAWDSNWEKPRVSRPLIPIAITPADTRFIQYQVKRGRVDIFGWGADHLWGWGLVDYYYLTGDIDALEAAKDLGEIVDRVFGWRMPGSYAMSFYGPRQGARHLLLATRLYEVTRESHWQTTMNHLGQLWLQSPDWDARGFYAVGGSSTDAILQPGAYAAGARLVPLFQFCFLSWALDRYYTVTGTPDARGRLIAMAQWAKQYGLHQTYLYAGSNIALDWPSPGQVWHSYFDKGALTFFSPYPTINLIDVLVRGYRFTRDQALLDRATYHWDRASKAKNGLPLTRTVDDLHAGRFMNKYFTTGGHLYADNGDLSYVGLLFHAVLNRQGHPHLSTVPAAPTQK